MDNIDMHIHTTASDGVLRPSEIVRWAVKLGLKGVAITDHDTLEGIEEAIQEGKTHPEFLVIPGIEFSTQYHGQEVHILGYFIDYKNEELIHLTHKIKEHRSMRGRAIVQKLIDLNYDIHFSDVEKLSMDGSIGRPHIGRILVQKGYVPSLEEAFDKVLKKGRPAYVERYKVTVEEAVEIIVKSGGIPVLAHPGLINKEINIKGLIDRGLKGIEVYHSAHTEMDAHKYLSMAKKNHLFITGGSDYHDGFEDGIPTIGSVSVPLHNITIIKRS